MTDTTPTTSKRGGRRTPGPGKKIGAPREEGTAWLVELRVLTPQEKALIKCMTPRERAQALTQHLTGVQILPA